MSLPKGAGDNGNNFEHTCSKIDQIKHDAQNSIGKLNEAEKMLAQNKSRLLEELTKFYEFSLKRDNVKCARSIVIMKMQSMHDKCDSIINVKETLQRKNLELLAHINEESDKRSAYLTNYEDKMQHLKTTITNQIPISSRPCIQKQPPKLGSYQSGGNTRKNDEIDNEIRELLKVNADVNMAHGVFKVAAAKLLKVHDD